MRLKVHLAEMHRQWTTNLERKKKIVAEKSNDQTIAIAA